MTRFILYIASLAGSFWAFAVPMAASFGDEPRQKVSGAEKASAEVGRDLLLNKAYLPADFGRESFDALWAVWPEPQRSAARAATTRERRRMIVERYGLHERPGWDGDLDVPPVGYVAIDDGWAMNCFACHAGAIGKTGTVLGMANSHYAMHSFARDMFAVKIRQLKRPAGIELGSQFVPLNQTDGVTNAVIFGIAVGGSRDEDLNVISQRPEQFVHHDMDAPAWWNTSRKSMLYCDAYAPKTHRVLMPFVMSSRNSGETVRSWEDDFRHILAFIESLEPPSYPYPVDAEKAGRGQVLFNERCAECHGRYGAESTYPELVVDIDVVGTDRVRLDALTPEHRRWTERGWLSRYGEDPVVAEPAGYLAPPLNGIWASAPYLHNGSVPTLWHLMHPEQRPHVWRRSREGYDRERVGLVLDAEGGSLSKAADEAEKRRYYDATRIGMSNEGHEFFDNMTDGEKAALLEYLKTL